MNAKTVKLIRKYGKVRKLDYNTLKDVYKKADKKQQLEFKKEMLIHIRA